MICTCGTNWAFALVLKGKVRRLTFSRALAEFIQSRNPDHEIMLLNLVPGEEAKPEDEGIFGIVDIRKGKLLRATVSQEEATYLTQDDSRKVVICSIQGQRKYDSPSLRNSA